MMEVLEDSEYVQETEWEFIHTFKSGKDGLLTTHKSFIFHRDSDARKGDLETEEGLRTFHVCSFKKAGCPGTATTWARYVTDEQGNYKQKIKLIYRETPPPVFVGYPTLQSLAWPVKTIG